MRRGLPPSGNHHEGRSRLDIGRDLRGVRRMRAGMPGGSDKPALGMNKAGTIVAILYYLPNSHEKYANQLQMAKESVKNLLHFLVTV